MRVNLSDVPNPSQATFCAVVSRWWLPVRFSHAGLLAVSNILFLSHNSWGFLTFWVFGGCWLLATNQICPQGGLLKPCNSCCWTSELMLVFSGDWFLIFLFLLVALGGLGLKTQTDICKVSTTLTIGLNLNRATFEGLCGRFYDSPGRDDVAH